MRHAILMCLMATPAAAQTADPAAAPGPGPGCLAAAVEVFDTGYLVTQLGSGPGEVVALPVDDQLWRGWTFPRADDGQPPNDDAALDRLDVLLQACPENADGYSQRATVHFRKQDFDAALADLDRALRIMPQHAAALSGRALTLMTLEREESARAMLRESIQLNLWLRYVALQDSAAAADR